jgi:hypothetical protein
MKFLFFSLVLVSCASPQFFGGKVVGPYFKHYDGTIECAYVEGWYKDVSCVCRVRDVDYDFNRVFLIAPDEILCKQSVYEHSEGK